MVNGKFYLSLKNSSLPKHNIQIKCSGCLIKLYEFDKNEKIEISPTNLALKEIN